MGLKKTIKRIIKLFEREIKNPVYVPVFEGSILQGKSILITGGASGIGYAVAKRAVANGAEVIIAGRDKEKLERAYKTLLKEGASERNLHYVVFDICNTEKVEDSILNAVNLTFEKKIDVLVNNAGVPYGKAIGATTEADYDRTMETNLKGTYFVSQAFSEYLIANNLKGNILNVSSTSGRRPAVSPYMLSKWGIVGLTEGLAKKLIKYDIVVNGIAPGPTATEMLGKDGMDLAHECSPAKRCLDATEVANLAVFLMSDMGRMIIGETVYISGGCGTLTLDDIEY